MLIVRNVIILCLKFLNVRYIGLILEFCGEPFSEEAVVDYVTAIGLIDNLRCDNYATQKAQ